MKISRKWKRVAQAFVSSCQVDGFQVGKQNLTSQDSYDTELEVFLLILFLSNFTFHMHDYEASVILRNSTVFK